MNFSKQVPRPHLFPMVHANAVMKNQVSLLQPALQGVIGIEDTIQRLIFS